MKKKLLFLVVVFSCLGVAFAQSVIENKIVPKRSAIQSTNMVFSDSKYTLSQINYDDAINEIQSKISEDTDNYFLYVSLADLYLKSKQYNNSYSELIFISHLASKNLLDTETLAAISNIKQRLTKLIRYEKNRFYIYTNLAVINLILKDYQSAQQCVMSASVNIENNEIFTDIFQKVYNTPESIDLALTSLDKILAVNPNISELKELKAGYLLQKGRKDQAMKEMVDVLAINPKNKELRYLLYSLLQTENISEKSLIKKLYPSGEIDYQKAYADIANMLFEKNDYAAAKQYASQLVLKYPQNSDGYILLTEISLKEGNLKEAYETLKLCRDKVDSNEAVAKYNVLLAKLSDEPIKEADSLMNNGLYSEALNVLQAASQENLYVILGQARANYFLDNKQLAYEYLNKAMSLYPNNADVFYYFAYILYSDGDIESSRKYLDQAFKVNPEHGYSLKLLDVINNADSKKYYNQIISSFESQNYSETMRLINEAISINPKDFALYYYQGLTYIALNNYAAATAPLYKALELDNTNIIAYFYLGLAFDNLSEPENALVYYKKFIELFPADNLGENEKLNYAKTRIEKLSK